MLDAVTTIDQAFKPKSVILTRPDREEENVHSRSGRFRERRVPARASAVLKRPMLSVRAKARQLGPKFAAKCRLTLRELGM